MALTTFTDEHAELFLQATHRAYLGIPEKPGHDECNRHIYSMLLPHDVEIDTIAQLEISRSWHLIAAIDTDGTAITTPFRDTQWTQFIYSMKNDDINDQLREMTLPRGALALSLSFEMLVERVFLNNGTREPTRVRQTIVALRGDRTLSLITQPGLGTDRAVALNGGTIDLLKEVMARTAP